MSGIKNWKTVAAGLALGLAGAWPGVAQASDGCVAGANTVDYLTFTANDLAWVDYTICGEGSGSNELDVKIQQQRSGGGWTTLVHFELNMPSDCQSGNFFVLDEFDSSTELLRVRLSRKIGTKKICYEVDLSY